MTDFKLLAIAAGGVKIYEVEPGTIVTDERTGQSAEVTDDNIVVGYQTAFQTCMYVSAKKFLEIRMHPEFKNLAVAVQ